MFGIIRDIVEVQNLKDELHKEQVKELNEQLSWSNQNNLEAEIYEQSLKERIAELEAQIEEMKNCGNCKNYSPTYGLCCYSLGDEDYDCRLRKWEIKEK